MNRDPVIVAVAAAALGAFVLFLLVFFIHLRLWVLALITNTPVSLFDILGMRLRRTPARLVVHAMIVLTGRGTKVSARDAEGYYRAAVVAGESVGTATELVNLISAVKRNAFDAPHT